MQSLLQFRRIEMLSKYNGLWNNRAVLVVLSMHYRFQRVVITCMCTWWALIEADPAKITMFSTNYGFTSTKVHLYVQLKFRGVLMQNKNLAIYMLDVLPVNTVASIHSYKNFYDCIKSLIQLTESLTNFGTKNVRSEYLLYMLHLYHINNTYMESFLRRR